MADIKAAPKFSLALGTKKAPSSQTTKSKRPHSSLQDSDDEDAGHAQPQEVSHFDQLAGGAIGVNGAKQSKGPLVIQSQKNRDFRDESRRKRQKNGLPAEAQARANGVVTKEPNGAGSGLQPFGLTVVEKSSVEEIQAASGEEANGASPTTAAPTKPKTDDELALEALTGNIPQSNLVLPAISEEEAFQRDYKSAPDMATLEQYAAVPVEEFGAALLRGMGWKDGEAIGKRRGQQAVQARVPERRPALLGIGAKSEAAAGIELGAWGKADKGPRRKKDQTYTPVVLRNKKTGEQLTEEELKAKLEEQKLVIAEKERESKARSRSRESDHRVSGKPSRRIKYGDEEDDYRREKERRRKDRDRSRDRNRDRDRDYDDRRHESSRRDRSSSVESSHGSRKQDGRHDRRDKERRRYEKGERDERESSRRHHHDRDRDRDYTRDRRR
ncbi:DNA primase large subunit Spp2 [Coniosporium apollinis]|uniref:Pre-mRNA-splicing factor n=1 Tax=Coniosporium apollinis TaxID=61459 RepID=A0ABQ9NPD7_9PEZI|nr:DNA primase large subunit Spp2 [Coniosporium apollinis]